MTAELVYAWLCLQCRAVGIGPKSDLEARRHETATGHATTTNLDRKEWSA